jgi:hypothetical protein
MPLVWKHIPRGGLPDWGINTMAIGVEIHIVPAEAGPLKPVADVLAQALNAEGIEARTEVGLGHHSDNPNTIHVVIGKKP